eukprot:gene49396-67141_t
MRLPPTEENARTSFRAVPKGGALLPSVTPMGCVCPCVRVYGPVGAAATARSSPRRSGCRPLAGAAGAGPWGVCGEGAHTCMLLHAGGPGWGGGWGSHPNAGGPRAEELTPARGRPRAGVCQVCVSLHQRECQRGGCRGLGEATG